MQALQNSAFQDLTQKFAVHANALRQDIIAFANRQPLIQKQLGVNVFYIAPVGANPGVGPANFKTRPMVVLA